MSDAALPLWDVCARRHGGNVESRAARIACRVSEQRDKVLAAVEAAGAQGVTCHELAAAWGVTPNTISGRFSELKATGHIRKAGTRKNAAGQRCGVLVRAEAAA